MLRKKILAASAVLATRTLEVNGALTDICATYSDALKGNYADPDPSTVTEYEFVFSHNEEMIVGLKVCKTAVILRNWTM